MSVDKIFDLTAGVYIHLSYYYHLDSSFPDRLSVCCLIVERRADVVPDAKHGGMTAFVIQLIDAIATLLLVASCVDRLRLVDTVRDYSAYDFARYVFHARVLSDENKNMSDVVLISH